MGSFLSFSKHYALAVGSTATLFALLVRLTGKPVIHWLYSGRFDDLAPMLYILAFLPLTMGIGNVLSSALNAAEKPKFVFLAYVCSGAATLLGGTPKVIHFGLRGAVLGLLGSAATYWSAMGVGFLFNFRRQLLDTAVPE